MIIYNVHENLHARTCMFTQGFGEKKHAYIFTYAHCKKYNVLSKHVNTHTHTHTHTHTRARAHTE